MCQWSRRHYSTCRHVDAVPPAQPCAEAQAKINAEGLPQTHRCPSGVMTSLPRLPDGAFGDCVKCDQERVRAEAFTQLATGPALQGSVREGDQRAPVRDLAPVAGPAPAEEDIAIVGQRQQQSRERLHLPTPPGPGDLNIRPGEQQADYLLRLMDQHGLSNEQAQAAYKDNNIKRLRGD